MKKRALTMMSFLAVFFVLAGCGKGQNQEQDRNQDRERVQEQAQTQTGENQGANPSNEKPSGERKTGAPTEAVEACEGKSEGDDCGFSRAGSNGDVEMTGTCQKAPAMPKQAGEETDEDEGEESLMCLSEDMKAGPGPMGPGKGAAPELE